jgi:uncharacterized protein involved in outer membrane biogenesis
MKLWKSPVFYFGIFLVLAVAAALIAPHVIAWDTYRADIEAYGRKLTGRSVSVKGPIQVSLFPWPDIRLADVRVANPEGAESPDFMRAESVRVSVTLAGLASGQIRVESIDVTKPEFWVERMANGTGTWQLTPEINLLGTEFGQRFRLDQIAVQGGRVNIIESRRGGAATIENVNATLSAAEMRGPWRLRGTGDYLGRTLDISLNTGSWRPEEPFKFSLRLAPGDGSGLTYALDGANTGENFEGSLKIEPAAAENGKSDAEGTLRPLVFNAQVKADFDGISLEKIEIAPRGSDGANLLGGSAEILLGEEIRLSSDLSATRFDLDSIAGAQMRTLLREGGGLPLLESLVDMLPSALEASVKVRVLSLVAGGESLENVVASIRAGSGTIRIDELSGKMPGQAEGLFTGIFAATDKGPQIAGDLAFEAFNLREFVSWLAPERKEEIARAWTGSRGMLKFEGRVDAAGNSFRISSANFQIDDTLGSGSALLTGGPRSSADFDIRAGVIDVDAFVPQGIQLNSAESSARWTEIAGLISPIIPGSLNVRLTAEKVRLNGVEAANVVLDTSSNATGIAINTLKAASLGDAEFDASGQINLSSSGPTGTGNAVIRAADPRGLLRLFGAIPNGQAPLWAVPLGATDMKVTFDLRAEQEGPALALEANGISGELALTGNAALKGAFDWQLADVTGAATINSRSSKALAQLVGWQVPEAAANFSPGSLGITASGILASGLEADIMADIFGARLQQKGILRNGTEGWSAEGQLRLETSNGSELVVALGLSTTEGPLKIDTSYTLKDSVLNLAEIAGQWQGRAISGSASISATGMITADLSTPKADLATIISATFLPWNGEGLSTETSFTGTWPWGLMGEVWIRPQELDVFGQYRTSENQIGAVANGDGKRLVVLGTAPSGGKVNMEAGITPRGDAFLLDAKVNMPADLGTALLREDGQAIAYGDSSFELKLEGEGRSPAAALAASNGSGTYAVKGLRLTGIDVPAFRSRLAGAKTAEDVRSAFQDLVASGGVDIGNVEGTIKISDGVAKLAPLRSASVNFDLTVEPMVEAATGRADINIRLILKGDKSLPPMDINYAGPPSNLSRMVDAAAMESQVSMDVLQKAMLELEAVQREQQRLLEEEARQAKIDAERLAAWEAHRKELQRRQRELKVQANTREENEKRYQAWLADLTKMVKPEMAQRSRELKTHRKTRLAAEKAQKEVEAARPPADQDAAIDATDVQPLPVPQTSPTTKPKSKPKAKAAAKPSTVEITKLPPPGEPLVLVPPAENIKMPPPGEPLVIVPPAEPRSRNLLDLFGLNRRNSTDGN